MKSLLVLLASSTLVMAADVSPYLSLQEEMKQAIARGNAWLAKQQKAEGFWDDPELPAFTALALTAAARDPNLKVGAEKPAHLKKGFMWLLSNQKEDGGIYNRGLSVYNTATSLTALVSAGEEGYEAAIVKARKHLINNQWDTGEKGKPDGINDGGVGYGSKNDRSDMSNTYLSIEAIKLSEISTGVRQFSFYHVAKIWSRPTISPMHPTMKKTKVAFSTDLTKPKLNPKNLLMAKHHCVLTDRCPMRVCFL